MHGAVREEEEEEEEYNLFNHSSKTTPGAALRTDGVGQSWRGVTVKMSP